MVISKPEYKFIFIRSFKNASTSVMNGIIKAGYFQEKISIMSRPYELFRSYFYKQLYGDYYKFAIVRNPYDRVVSRYYYDIDHNGTFANMSFLRYVQFNINSIKKLSNLYYITDDNGRIFVDDLCHFEHLKYSLSKVFNNLRLPMINVKYLNKGKNRKSRKYQDVYCQKSYDIVTQLFLNELNVLGYKFDEN